MHPVRLLLVALAFAWCGRHATALETGKYKLDIGGTIRGVRTADVDGDGRLDLVALVETEAGGDELVLLRTPKVPAAGRFFPDDHVTRIPCDGALADAGAVCVGRFARNGEVRIRFLGPGGIIDLYPTGDRMASGARWAKPTLFARSPGRPLVFWDGLGDLDGDGADEVWFPLAEGNGAMRVFAGRPAGDRTLALEPRNQGSRSPEHLLVRSVYVPNLVAADMDGDGRRELVTVRGNALVGWTVGDAPAAPSAPLEATFRLPLPFLERAPDQDPREVSAPRLQLADVDGDGTTDLMVTLVWGRADKIGLLRTTLFHYPGPIQDSETNELVKPLARIDTESVVLHPQFVDLDGDDKLEYVGDTIRGNLIDLLARIAGQPSKIHFVGFRFHESRGTYEPAPYFTVERLYSSEEALQNKFGLSGWFGGDFDGDGHKDLLDLGQLDGVEIVGAVKQPEGPMGDPCGYAKVLMGKTTIAGLTANAVIEDLNGDGRSDAVLWSDDALYLVVSKEEAK